ncbi:hypothetical protein B0T19DRAFT_56927 [Cercophora scortea]|uniref:Uncharacterized protein n=1 Tax=Cercophora scortea TaxID=314031 RepID=A0AAE0J4T2_9PEZI|nr:hypothetical protein B0T19DRAFT_56927 [Cercophora scortea]
MPSMHVQTPSQEEHDLVARHPPPSMKRTEEEEVQNRPRAGADARQPDLSRARFVFSRLSSRPANQRRESSVINRALSVIEVCLSLKKKDGVGLLSQRRSRSRRTGYRRTHTRLVSAGSCLPSPFFAMFSFWSCKIEPINNPYMIFSPGRTVLPCRHCTTVPDKQHWRWPAETRSSFLAGHLPSSIRTTRLCEGNVWGDTTVHCMLCL